MFVQNNNVSFQYPFLCERFVLFPRRNVRPKAAWVAVANSKPSGGMKPRPLSHHYNQSVPTFRLHTLLWKFRSDVEALRKWIGVLFCSDQVDNKFFKNEVAVERLVSSNVTRARFWRGFTSCWGEGKTTGKQVVVSSEISFKGGNWLFWNADRIKLNHFSSDVTITRFTDFVVSRSLCFSYFVCRFIMRSDFCFQACQFREEIAQEIEL